MPKIFNEENLTCNLRESPISEFSWHTANLQEILSSEYIAFDVRSPNAGKYSYPYHSHRNAEELFVILSGKAMLRTPDGFMKQSRLISFF